MAPTVRFVHPPFNGPATGGHVYNREMLRAAAATGFPLISTPCGPGSLTVPKIRDPAGEVVLWDSLFIQDLAGRPAALSGIRQGLLVHYLPYRNPLLTRSEQADWRGWFNHVASRMDFLVATGEMVASDLAASWPDRPVALCPPGVDPAFIECRSLRRPIQPHRPVRIITVANLLPAKRPIELLEMLVTLDAEWEWHLAGDAGFDPAYAGRLSELIRTRGCKRRVVLHGCLNPPSLARLMLGMDVFASYSAYETYGMALAEAVACGLPVVATAVGSAARLIGSNETGFIVPWDEAEQFRHVLERLIREPGLRQRFSLAALDRRPRTWDQAFQDFVRLPWIGTASQTPVTPSSFLG